MMIAENFKMKRKLDVKTFANLYCFKNGVSKRTFAEYLDIALTLAGGRLQGGFIVEND